MRNFLVDKRTLARCKIWQMLAKNAKKPHISFHTPGHKIGKWDITELSFSDNLACPRGCIAEAEKEIAQILDAKKSFILTDGSTSGVFSMLHAAKSAGAKRVLFAANSHQSVYNGCKALGLQSLVLPVLSIEAVEGDFSDWFDAADAVLITSPDYYGNIAPLQGLSDLCKRRGKILLCDGAHGGHLHFQKEIYAGAYADMWVDGVHKSLPALTQGAVVSATKEYAERLAEAVTTFRTTSPSYPIMASVEYAVKYPRNEGLEREVRAFASTDGRIELNDDWTKLCALFGACAFTAAKKLESRGVYAEFCDGERLCFYLSPATKARDFKRLKKELFRLFEKYPYTSEKNGERIPAPLLLTDGEREWTTLDESVGRVCAVECGLFPPCTPLLNAGEKITEEKIALLKAADNVFGLKEGKICVVKEKDE